MWEGGREETCLHSFIYILICSFICSASNFFFVEQKYTGSGLSLLELPKKHVHTVLITFKEAEAEAYKKIEMYFTEQYTVCKESSANGVSVRCDVVGCGDVVWWSGVGWGGVW